MEYRVLGPLEARREGTAVPIRGARQRTVLALLLLEADRIVPTDRLVDGVWDEDPPATSRSQIHICISSLRRQLSDGGENVRTAPPGYRLQVAAGELDLHTFEAHLARARGAQRDGEPRRAVAALRAALALWNGPALAGIESRLVRSVAAVQDERRLAVCEEALGLELEHGPGDPASLVAELAGLVAAHPRRERLLELLMTALYRAGRQAEALAEYRRARTEFIGDLGIEPGKEVRNLYQRILTQDPALSRRRPAGHDAAAGPGGPGAGGVITVRGNRPRRLPADIVDFTGRGRSLAALTAAVAAQDGAAVPTVVVSGHAGVGKTTLAVHAAHRLADGFPDGQLFARLSEDGVASDPGAVLGRFLRAFGVADPDLPAGLEERAETFREHLADRRVLVVLDGALSESQVFPLLPGTSRSRVIVTSRQPLSVLPATARVRLTHFGSPSALELVARIAGRARIQADPDASVALAELCGHLPLALRLAATRLSAHPHWTVTDLIGRLSNGSDWLDELESQVGLRHTYEALPAPARRLFRLLPLVGSAQFASWVGAPLLDTGVAESEALLDELADADLLIVHPDPDGAGTRYRIPGWLLGYARRQQAQELPECRHKALERLLGALLHVSEEAHWRMGGHRLREVGNLASRWELPGPLVERMIADVTGWYRRERSWMLAAVRQATAAGFAEHAWGLALCTVTLAEPLS